jgi:putative salt-induced outer membrane protein
MATMFQEARRMKRILLALLLVGAHLPVLAQNPPAPPPPPAPGAPAPAPGPPDPLTGQVAVGYLATSGNTESTSANVTFAMLYKLERWAHDFDASAISATSSEVTTTEAYSAKYEGRRAIGEGKSYLFTSLDWRRDRFSAYSEQVSETAGYGRRLLSRGNQVLNGEIGAGARQATLIDETEEDEGIVRGALDYEFKMSETTDFKQDFIVESGSSNTSFESVSALRARLVGKIGLVLSYRVKSNSEVLPGVVDTDRFTSIALEYAF